MFGISKRDFILVSLLNIIWGSAFAVAGYAMKYFSEFFLYSMRFFIVGLLTIPFFQISNRKNMIKLVAMGFFQAFTFFGVALAVKNLDSSISAIVTRLDIIFTMILGIAIFREKLTAWLVTGVAICVLAIVVLNGEIAFVNSKYIYLLVLSSLSSGILNIISKTIKGEKNLAIVSWNSYFTGIFLLIVSLVTEKQFILQPIDYKGVLCVLYISVFSSYIAYWMLYYLLQNNPTTRIMPYNFLRPVIAVFAGLILLGEKITTNKILGIVLITVGVLLSQYKKAERVEKKENKTKPIKKNK
jgi:O-acetylserine/cysteine efflux transporter